MKQNELPTDISLAECGQRLLEADDIYILSHQYPDGDTLGSAAALCRLLLQKGKRVRTLCSDEIPKKFADLYQGLPQEEFSPAFVVAVDVADVKLLGKKLEHFGDKIDLCIDHHGSNKRYARWNYVDPTAAAAAEMIAQLANLWGVALDPAVADAIFTGITTDTGCFKYTNATSRTYRIAADMIDAGADASRINRIMFDTKSRARLEIERRVLDTMRFYGRRTGLVTSCGYAKHGPPSQTGHTSTGRPLSVLMLGRERGSHPSTCRRMPLGCSCG